MLLKEILNVLIYLHNISGEIKNNLLKTMESLENTEINFSNFGCKYPAF